MEEIYLHDKVFGPDDILLKGEYENCIFNNGSYADMDLSGFKFAECIFNNCNLSMARLTKTAFREVQFNNCKMLGLRFDSCHPIGLSFSFDGCQLDHASFYQMKIRKTVFRNSQLQDTDLVEADLSGSVFDNCNLLQTVFENTILEQCDFSTAYHYSIDPAMNNIKKAKFSVAGLPGLLHKYDIEIV